MDKIAPYSLRLLISKIIDSYITIVTKRKQSNFYHQFDICINYTPKNYTSTDETQLLMNLWVRSDRENQILLTNYSKYTHRK